MIVKHAEVCFIPAYYSRDLGDCIVAIFPLLPERYLSLSFSIRCGNSSRSEHRLDRLLRSSTITFILKFIQSTWSRLQGFPLEPWQGAVCGAMAGGTAAAITTPLDVAKTRIMLAKVNHDHIILSSKVQTCLEPEYIICSHN